MAEKRNVLVVDDDATLREFLRIGLTNIGNIECITASNGLEGIEKVRQNRIDLLITDLQMPEMDGITFLSYMMEEFPHVPRVVMTSMGEKSRDYVVQTGIVAILSKPVDMTVLADNVNKWIDSYRPHTYTEGVDLSSLLQLASLDNMTCTIGVQDKKHGRIGLLHIHEGELVDASAGNLTGLDAAMSILLWRDVRIWIHDFTSSNKDKINSPLQAILMNAALEKDEGGKNDEIEHHAVPSAKWIRENRPDEVNVKTTVSGSEPTFLSNINVLAAESSEGTEEISTETNNSTISHASREHRFVKKVTDVLKEHSVQVNEIDNLFDKAISSFRAKDYEKSREIWLKTGELAPEHPVIKQNLKILEKYLS